jgi:hypothetical protein
MLQVSHANVSKLGLNFSMLQILIFMLQILSTDVADMCCWVLQTLNFNVADIGYSMLQTCDVGIYVEDEGEESSLCWMLHATRAAT